MKFDQAKLLKLRGDIDRYLKSLEQKEKDDYRKLALSFERSQTKIDEVLARIENDKTYDRLALLLRGLKAELGEAIRGIQFDSRPIVEGLAGVQEALSRKKDFSDEGIVRTLNRIEKLLAKPEKAQDRTDELIEAIKSLTIEIPKVEIPSVIQAEVTNFPPQKIPQPVTNININPLRGEVLTTAVSVGTTATALPETPLENRRSFMVFNNDESKTIYLGGSGVTTDSGLPVLAQSYSPTIDAGPKMIVYGITASGTVDVRVIEASNENIGG